MKNFIIDLEYKAPIEEIEKHLEPHMDYIHAGRDKGYFISWGPKVPRSGGLIIAQAETREEIEAFAATDPFIVEGVSNMAITEFVARREIKHG